MKFPIFLPFNTEHLENMQHNTETQDRPSLVTGLMKQGLCPSDMQYYASTKEACKSVGAPAKMSSGSPGSLHKLSKKLLAGHT